MAPGRKKFGDEGVDEMAARKGAGIQLSVVSWQLAVGSRGGTGSPAFARHDDLLWSWRGPARHECVGIAKEGRK